MAYFTAGSDCRDSWRSSSRARFTLVHLNPMLFQGHHKSSPQQACPEATCISHNLQDHGKVNLKDERKFSFVLLSRALCIAKGLKRNGSTSLFSSICPELINHVQGGNSLIMNLPTK
jgi:hypothetical protein